MLNKKFEGMTENELEKLAQESINRAKTEAEIREKLNNTGFNGETAKIKPNGFMEPGPMWGALVTVYEGPFILTPSV